MTYLRNRFFLKRSRFFSFVRERTPRNPMKNQTPAFTKRILFLFALLCAAIASVQNAHAATTWNVQYNGGNPPNAANCPGAFCSLRDALAAASDGDTINFALPSFITSYHLNDGE